MRNAIVFLFAVFILTACTRTYYIVRHAEKAAVPENTTMMSNDPTLTEAGKQRAEALKEILRTKKIGYVFSTNTIRTKSTAEPTRSYFNLVTETYSPIPDSVFVNHLKSLKKNVLIVGHSNTVDDIVNKLCRSVKLPADLKETEYDNLFVIKKRGRNLSFENLKYGAPSL